MELLVASYIVPDQVFAEILTNTTQLGAFISTEPYVVAHKAHKLEIFRAHLDHISPDADNRDRGTAARVFSLHS